jgi:hypothetical protein
MYHNNYNIFTSIHRKIRRYSAHIPLNYDWLSAPELGSANQWKMKRHSSRGFPLSSLLRPSTFPVLAFWKGETAEGDCFNHILIARRVVLERACESRHLSEMDPLSTKLAVGYQSRKTRRGTTQQSKEGRNIGTGFQLVQLRER